MAKRKEKLTSTEIFRPRIEIFCSKLNKCVSAPVDDADKVSWDCGSGECESCGSHGGIDFSILCECGKWHKVEVYSW